jgi:hypothetical protein
MSTQEPIKHRYMVLESIGDRYQGPIFANIIIEDALHLTNEEAEALAEHFREDYLCGKHLVALRDPEEYDVPKILAAYRQKQEKKQRLEQKRAKKAQSKVTAEKTKEAKFRQLEKLKKELGLP